MLPTFTFQHLMLAMKGLIAYAIPDTPQWVATEMAKIEYKRREIEKSSNLSQPSFSEDSPARQSSLESDSAAAGVSGLTTQTESGRGASYKSRLSPCTASEFSSR